MSADEDTELRDLVAQTLEANGVLGKIRAQLRASVFLALEEQESIQNKTPFLNNELQKFLATNEGCNVVLLIKEFLQFFKLDYTLAVFEPELSCASDKLDCSRNKLSRQIGLTESSETAKAPLLAAVVRQYKAGDNDRRPSLIKMHFKNDDQENQALPETLIEEARCKFDLYDKDNSGQIEKDELRDLFCNMFPDFHRNMLDRYVNDEFRFADKDFSNGIDFEEFLEIYRRLIIRCKASSGDIEQDSINDSLKFGAKNSNEVKVAETNGDIAILNPITRPAPSGKSEPGANTLTVGHKNSTGSDVDSDSFFDDMVFEKKPLPQDKKEEAKIPVSVTAKAGGTSNMTSLAGLPSLTNGRSVVNRIEEVKDLDDISNPDYDDDDKYEDDFQGSNPLNQTPRSLSSSEKPLKSVENEEIGEEIEEDFSSIAEDLLKSDRSLNDDLTTDRTVSGAEQSAAGDYLEDVLRS